MSWEYLPALLTLLALSYTLGAISFAKIVSSLKGVDLLTFGSGNLGSTNVYRAFGLKIALLVFVADVLKAAIPTMLSQYVLDWPLGHVLVGGMAVVGHSLSVFANFKGGKGVAPALGMILALNPLVFFIIFPVGALLIAKFRYVAPVSIGGSILVPILMWVFHDPLAYIAPMCFVSAFIIIKHKANILRLLSGKENRI